MKIIDFLLKKKNLLFIIIALLSLAFSLKIGNVEMQEDEETFISSSDPVLITYREFQNKFEADEGIVVAFSSPDIFSENELDYLEDLHLRLENLTGVSEVKSLINCENIVGVADGIEIKPIAESSIAGQYNADKAAQLANNNPLIEGVYLSPDQKVTALIITLPGMFSGGSDELHNTFYNELMQLVETDKELYGRELNIGGDIVTDCSVEEMMNTDLELLFPLSIVLCALILLLFYRTLATTIVPLIPILLAIGWVIGLKGWTNIPMTPISITLFPLIMVIGMANSVHIINHYKKIRPTVASNYLAMQQTLNTVLIPCMSAAITTAIGFGSLMVSSVTGIKQMGAFAAFGVLAAFVLSIVIVPGILVQINIFSKKPTVKQPKKHLTNLLDGINSLNEKHPRKVITLFVIIAAMAVVYIPKIKVEGSMTSFAKEKTKLRSDIRFIDENLSGINAFELVVSGNDNDFKNPDILEAFESVERKMSTNEKVLKVFGINTLVKTISKALHADDQSFYRIPESDNEVAQYLFLYEISGGNELFSFVNESYSTARLTIRTKQMSNIEQKIFIEELQQLANAEFGNITWGITGFGMLMSHINDNLINTQIESILLALGIILVMMFILFGIKGGLLSIFPNVFPILFFLGLMGVLGIDINMATSIIAAITIGIVVDDTIHVFYGYKHEMKNLKDVSSAIKTTMRKTGAALCTTSLILTLGFGILAFSNSKFITDFGLMSASAIVAALAGDLFISPIVLVKSKLFT